MLLPYKITPWEIETICAYLARKPEGATGARVSARLYTGDSGNHRRSACRWLGFIEEAADQKLKVTKRGRDLVRNSGRNKPRCYREAIADLPAYRALVEWAASGGMRVVETSHVSDFWHQRFPSLVSGSQISSRRQAIVLFRLMERASLGRLIIGGGMVGRRTRFTFDAEQSRAFLEESAISRDQSVIKSS